MSGAPSKRTDLVRVKSALIMDGRGLLDTDRHGDGVRMLLEAARLETILAETAGTDPNGPRKEDHLRSAESLRALAHKPRAVHEGGDG